MEFGSTWTAWESNLDSALWPLAIFWRSLRSLPSSERSARRRRANVFQPAVNCALGLFATTCLTRVEPVCPWRTRLQALHLHLRFRLELQLALPARSACEDRSWRPPCPQGERSDLGWPCRWPRCGRTTLYNSPGCSRNDRGRNRLRLFRARSHLSPRIHPIHTPRGPSDRKQGVVRPRYRSVQMRNGTFTQGHAKFKFGVNTWSI